jgi:hypothetical protein
MVFIEKDLARAAFFFSLTSPSRSPLPWVPFRHTPNILPPLNGFLAETTTYRQNSLTQYASTPAAVFTSQASNPSSLTNKYGT